MPKNPLQPPVSHPDVQQAPSQPVTGAKPCTVVENPDGSLTVTFNVDPMYVGRLKSRAYKVPLDVYMWDNILKRAVIDHVF